MTKQRNWILAPSVCDICGLLAPFYRLTLITDDNGNIMACHVDCIKGKT